MQGMEGWEVLRQFKSTPELRDIPIIIMSGLSEEDKAYMLGAQDYLFKPVSRSRLREVLERHSSHPDARDVLLVEDDAVVRTLLERKLLRDGWRVRGVENGVRALEALEEALPDVILLDLMMPEMDGFEVLTRLRAEESWREIPVIVLTAMSLDESQRAMLRRHAQLVVSKGDASQPRSAVSMVVEELARLVKLPRS